MEDYKEKYEQALERANAKIKTYNHLGNTSVVKSICEIFSELKESEDERIRKEIIQFLQLPHPQFVGKRNHEEWIAWLEKQGEQKPTDKVEPKFGNGQWIVWQDKCYKVNYNGCGYELIDQNGMKKSLIYGTIDENAHLWDIAKDAKDGDVLLFEGCYNSIVLFQGIGINGKGRINYHCKCDLGNYSFGIQGNVAYLGTIDSAANNYHPATKEQRDILFQKMKEAGYEFDVEKKELKKIEQKSVWSEEDEMMLETVLYKIGNLGTGEMCKEWLKFIKERLKGE